MRTFERSAFVAALALLVTLAAWGEALRAVPGSKVAAALPPRKAGPTPLDRKPSVGPLRQEVLALQALYYLELTPAQLRFLAGVAPTTVQKPGPRRDITVSVRCRKVLADLHAALLAADDERIDELDTTLDTLLEKEGPEFDEVEITAAARKQAPVLLRKLSARQVANYIAVYAELVPDPRELLVDGLKQSRELRGSRWSELRDEIAEQVGWLVAGLDAAEEAKVQARAKALLSKSFRLPSKEYPKERKALLKEVQDIVARVSPTDVLRHFMEHELADLLSNPRLVEAVKALQGK
jgi:hypothetical protein